MRSSHQFEGMRTATARLLLAYVSVSAVLLFSLTFSSGNAAAEGAEGTWTQRTSGEGFVQDTWPADWHYDVTLKLSGGTGSWWMKVIRVTNVQPGQESARSTVGNTFSYSVSYTSTSSGINLVMEGKTLPLKVSGGLMTGSGTYSISGTTINWKVDLKGGSGVASLGEMGPVAAAGAAVAVVGAVAGMAAAVAPAPKPIPIRSHPGLQNLQARPPNPQRGPYERWMPQNPQIYPNAPPQQPYSVAPGDARPFEPVPFNPPTPDPSQMQSLGGVGITQGPPDTPPPPTPPRGQETRADNNPTCPRCHQKTIPTVTPTVYGYRWQCTSPSCNGWLPWG